MLCQIIATVCVVPFAGPASTGEATVTVNKISGDGIRATISTIIVSPTARPMPIIIAENSPTAAAGRIARLLMLDALD